MLTRVISLLASERSERDTLRSVQLKIGDIMMRAISVYSTGVPYAARFTAAVKILLPKQRVLNYIGSNCPGISGTVPDLLTLSLVPEGLPICPGRSLISS